MQKLFSIKDYILNQEIKKLIIEYNLKLNEELIIKIFLFINNFSEDLDDEHPISRHIRANGTYNILNLFLQGLVIKSCKETIGLDRETEGKLRSKDKFYPTFNELLISYYFIRTNKLVKLLPTGKSKTPDIEIIYHDSRKITLEIKTIGVSSINRNRRELSDLLSQVVSKFALKNKISNIRFLPSDSIDKIVDGKIIENVITKYDIYCNWLYDLLNRRFDKDKSFIKIPLIGRVDYFLSEEKFEGMNGQIIGFSRNSESDFVKIIKNGIQDAVAQLSNSESPNCIIFCDYIPNAQLIRSIPSDLRKRIDGLCFITFLFDRYPKIIVRYFSFQKKESTKYLRNFFARLQVFNEKIFLHVD
ncbi:hypothetical protein [Leptospira kirschneri]|uniref:hypothetical protein n=1 Tax=Leptospira kirschneri TaxID=29507 RepID=UPI0002BD7A64|nr:hypothetical protein [Leptospira kirschneri]EMN25368.1 hypothetical protein LEP1GSC065_2281 [Leptospira kirschneri serovar Sokoine str. RM1]